MLLDSIQLLHLRIPTISHLQKQPNSIHETGVLIRLMLYVHLLFASAAHYCTAQPLNC